MFDAAKLNASNFTNVKGSDDSATLRMTSDTLSIPLFKICNQSDLCGLNDSGRSNNTSAIVNPLTYQFPHFAIIIIGFLAATGSIITVLGNLMVIISFVIERSIRQPTNYFIASLAFSDLLIGTFSMPLFTTYMLLGEWPLGPWICDLWLSLDWTVCLASQYTVFAITADRFCSVNIPAKYRNWRTDRKVRVIIGIVWIIPTSIFFTTIVGWQYFVGRRTIEERECDVMFMGNKLFVLLLTLGYYWITLAVMICLYAGIYSVALKLQRKSDAKQKKMNSTIGMMCDQLRLGISMTHGNVIQNAETLEIPKPVEHHINNGRANNNTPAVTTTSFSTTNKADTTKEKDEDRSSSPCFPSDEDNSSQTSSHPRMKSSKGGKHTGRQHKKTRREPGSVEETKNLVNSPTENKNMMKVMEECPEFHVKHVGIDEERTNRKLEPDARVVTETLISRNEYEEDSVDDARSRRVDYDDRNMQQITESSKDAAMRGEVCKGNMYIDMDCLKSFISFENIKLIDDLSDDELALNDTDDSQLSPVWKKRASLQDHIALPLTGPSDLSSISQLTFDINADKPSTSSEGAIPPPTYAEAINEGVSKSNFSKSTSSEQATKGDGIIPDPAVETSECATSSRRNRLASFVKNVGSRKPKKVRAKREREKGKSKSENRARKALRTITLILGAFVLCWTPYHILILVKAYCKYETCVNDHVYNFVYWLCYLNSPINPFCYAFANAQFKRTFIRILKFDWHRT